MTEQGKPDEDPTADFLDDVRPEETPWRVDRAARGFDAVQAEQVSGPPERWRRTKAVGRVAGRAAPYVQAAAVIGWLAGGGFDGGGFEDGGQDSGHGLDS